MRDSTFRLVYHLAVVAVAVVALAVGRWAAWFTLAMSALMLLVAWDAVRTFRRKRAEEDRAAGPEPGLGPPAHRP